MYRHKINFISTISLVIGNIIGVGIFTTTGYVANFIDSPIIILMLWILGAIYALCGSVVYGILSKEYSLSGGDFQYLSKEIHPILGYIFGWSAVVVTYTGSIAALSIGASYYFFSATNFSWINDLNYSIFNNWQFIINDEKIMAIFLVFAFSWINFKGIRLSADYQKLLTLFIIIFIIFFSLIGIFGSDQNYFIQQAGGVESFDLKSFLTAFIAVIFTYIGWTSAVYIAEEIEKPKRSLPKSLFLGVSAVSALYLLINFFYIKIIPMEALKNTINVANTASEILWGKNFSVIVSTFIFIAVLSTLNSTILSGSRIYMAMSREGYLWGKFSVLHKKYNSPYKAIILQFIWSLVLILSGSFNQLLSFVVFVVLLFSILAGIISIKIMIKKRIVNLIMYGSSIIFTLICGIVALNSLYLQFIESMIGIALIMIAIPLYIFEVKILKHT